MRKILSEIKGVFFDFDGVVGDTMEDNYQAWRTAFRSLGVTIDKHEYFQHEGRGRYDIAERLLVRYDLSPGLKDNVVETKENYYRENNTFRVFAEVPGIIHFIQCHKKRIALVTGASRSRVSLTLPRDLFEKFDILITSDDVAVTKPDPAPYLLAMNSLNLLPEECLVLENAPLGILAAKRAGMLCFAVTTTLAAEYLTEADQVFENHHSLYQWLNGEDRLE